MKKLWMSWSTGKDSAYALYKLQQDPRFVICGLFTTVNKDTQRVAMHSTRETLLQLQCEALDLPLELVKIPASCTNEEYESAMAKLIQKAKAKGVETMGFGDLFLEDVRQYRERILAGSGIEPVFPLWHCPTDNLAQEMLAAGIKAILTCVDSKKLPGSFSGRHFDQDTIAEFPEGIDPCGENGEFHTFVFASPSFRKKIRVSRGTVLEREGFIFTDVLPVQ